MSEDSKDPLDLSYLLASLGNPAPFDDDDLHLRTRIESLVNPQGSMDIYREDSEAVAIAVLKTLSRQFSSGTPSPEAIRYVASRFAAYLKPEAGSETSLDATFFMNPRRARGGQAKQEGDELDVCQAYISTLRLRTHWYDAVSKELEVTPVTREIRLEAERMATEAHYGKSTARLEHWEEKFKRTVRPILQKHGVIKKRGNTSED